jgi:hypothetical protein
VPVSQNGTLSPTSFTGTAASTNGDIGSFSGLPQDWYNVTLTAGQTYVISASTTASLNTYLSLQFNGVEVAFNDNSGQGWLGYYGYPAQIAYTPTTTGVYTVIVASVGGQPGSYTLTIPNPAPTASPISLPFAAGGTFTATNYYGAAAASSMGSPPMVVTWDGQNLPAWVDYFQNWYSFPMTAGENISITMTIVSGGNPVLSLQNSSGTQVAYSYTGSSPVTLNYTATSSGSFTLICSQDVTGPGNSYALSLSGPAGSVGTTTTVYPGIDIGNANLNVTVKVSALGGTPTGSVILSVDGNPVGTQTLSSGSTVFNITNPGPGNHTLSATYAGSLPNYLPSSGSAALVTGIPNVRLVPRAGNNADFEITYALGLPLRPVGYTVERAALECRVASLEYRKG